MKQKSRGGRYLMNPGVRLLLQEIGRQLDQGVFPRVTNGGFVVLSEPAVPLTLGTENDHESEERQRRPAAGSRSGSAGWQGPSGGSRPPGHATPVVGADLQAQVEDQLSGLHQQYPGAQLWHQDDGVWLLTTSKLLPGLSQYAIFLTGISFPWRMVRSWAFWGHPLSAPVWIGPRHTNFPDGSICAFEPTDGTWALGDSPAKLLDIYTLWAVRHLHLQVLGRWPGRQRVHYPAERLLELRPDEYCGCANGDKLYGECCMSDDLARNRIRDALTFFWRSGGFREPPHAVTTFVRDLKQPPDLRSFSPILDTSDCSLS